MGIIRLLLAISVVIWHSKPIFGLTLIGGPNAVDIFFVISGFYIALILEEKYNKTTHPIRTFLSNRFLKIFPSYWICLILSILIGVIGMVIYKNSSMFTPYLEYFRGMKYASIFYLLFSNIFILGQDVMLFLGFNRISESLYFTISYVYSNPQVTNFFPVGQAWSISLELMFYILAPFLAKLKTKSLTILILLSLACRVIIYKIGLNYDPWTYRFFPLEIVFFLAGILTFRLYTKIKEIINIKPLSIIPYIIIISSIFIYQFILSNIDPEFKRWLLYVLVIPLIPFSFIISKNIRFDRFIGELSYPIYLSHNIFIYITRELLGYKGIYEGLYVMILSVLFSILLLKFVIYPIDRIRQAKLSIYKYSFRETNIGKSLVVLLK